MNPSRLVAEAGGALMTGSLLSYAGGRWAGLELLVSVGEDVDVSGLGFRTIVTLGPDGRVHSEYVSSAWIATRINVARMA